MSFDTLSAAAKKAYLLHAELQSDEAQFEAAYKLLTPADQQALDAFIASVAVSVASSVSQEQIQRVKRNRRG